MTNLEWRHNDDLDRWELGYPLVYKRGMNVVSWIRSEVIDELKDKPGFPDLVKEKFGSLPPPMQEEPKQP